VAKNRTLSAAYRVIQHNVSRTDRQVSAFAKDGGIGLQMVTHLLQAYCVFNPPIGYLQGMNDLFVPILRAFLPTWNDDGFPVDENGNVLDHREFLSIIFWCFEAMFCNISHLDLLENVIDECKVKSIAIEGILRKVSPLVAIWMNRARIHTLLWLYSDFVLLFKRSFSSDVWPVWLQLNCAPNPGNWIDYFVTAILVLGFGRLKSLQNVGLTTLMEEFPKILMTLDRREIGRTALWLTEKVPPKVRVENGVQLNEQRRFRFFETGWIGPSQTWRAFHPGA
jgi:hypothetical protein